MARIIDADALKAKAFGKRKGLVHVADIDAAPTIAAIPVEWLRGLMLSTEDDVDKVELAWIMREWESEKKEQEAHGK